MQLSAQCRSDLQLLQVSGLHRIEHQAINRQHGIIDHIFTQWIRITAQRRLGSFAAGKKINWWDQKRMQPEPFVQTPRASCSVRFSISPEAGGLHWSLLSSLLIFWSWSWHWSWECRWWQHMFLLTLISWRVVDWREVWKNTLIFLIQSQPPIDWCSIHALHCGTSRQSAWNASSVQLTVVRCFKWRKRGFEEFKSGMDICCDILMSMLMTCPSQLLCERMPSKHK